jgi:RimJ/RimL family protein N-acetyltransferase
MDSLETARLVLHPMTIDEAKRVVAGEPDDAASWAPGYPTEGDVFAARRLRRREDGKAIGGVGFHATPDNNGSVTIGYGLIPSVHGNGYASEALRALLDFAREVGVSSVHGDTNHDNISSQRVMTAAGMRLIAEDEKLKYYTIDWAN